MTPEWTRSVGWIWLAWALSSALSVGLSALALSRLRPGHFRRLLRQEGGSAYTLSYVMVLPFYVATVVGTIETTMLLLAKCGTVYAAYAAARTGCVQASARGQSEAERMAEAAAARAMVPFASGMTTPAGPSSRGALAYVAAYRAAARSPASSRYLLAKYDYAERATRVRLERRPLPGGVAWEADQVATVEYRYPFLFSVVGRVLGERDERGRLVYRITSRAALQDECPQNESLSLGISYASPIP